MATAAAPAASAMSKLSTASCRQVGRRDGGARDARKLELIQEEYLGGGGPRLFQIQDSRKITCRMQGGAKHQMQDPTTPRAHGALGGSSSQPP